VWLRYIAACSPCFISTMIIGVIVVILIFLWLANEFGSEWYKIKDK